LGETVTMFTIAHEKLSEQTINNEFSIVLFPRKD